MALIKKSSSGKDVLQLDTKEWVAQGIFNGWFSKEDLEVLTKSASLLINDKSIKDQCLIKMSQYIDDYAQAEQMQAGVPGITAPVARKKRTITPEQQAKMRAAKAAKRGVVAAPPTAAPPTAAPPTAAPPTAAAPTAAAPTAGRRGQQLFRTVDPRTGKTVFVSPQTVVKGLEKNRFGDSARVTWQRMQGMSPQAQQALRDQLASTPRGQEALRVIDQFGQQGKGLKRTITTNSVPGMSGFVQRLDPVTGRPISQLAGMRQDIAGKITGAPGAVGRSLGKTAPQMTQNLGTVGRGIGSAARGAGSAARGFGSAAVRGLASGPQVGLGAGVGLGGLLTGGAGAYLGAKAYQYFRDRSVHNQNVNQAYLQKPEMAQKALMGLAQLNQLESLKGATNSIDDAIDRLKAYAVAAVGKVEQGPAGQQLLSGFNPNQQQEVQQQ